MLIQYFYRSHRSTVGVGSHLFCGIAYIFVSSLSSDHLYVRDGQSIAPLKCSSVIDDIVLYLYFKDTD